MAVKKQGFQLADGNMATPGDILQGHLGMFLHKAINLAEDRDGTLVAIWTQWGEGPPEHFIALGAITDLHRGVVPYRLMRLKPK